MSKIFTPPSVVVVKFADTTIDREKQLRVDAFWIGIVEQSAPGTLSASKADIDDQINKSYQKRPTKWN